MRDWLDGFIDEAEVTEDQVRIDEFRRSIAYKNFAVQCCMNLISSTVSIAEFRTYKDGKEIREGNYYSLNIEPNQNQNASAFWRAVVEKLVYDHEALVVPLNGKWYLAQSFNKEEYSVRDNVYSQINLGIDKEFILREEFKEREVLYFRLNNKQIMAAVDSIYEDFKELISASQKAYLKESDTKALITYDADYAHNSDRRTELNTITNDYFKDFMTPGKNSYLPLTKGLGYTEVGKDVSAGNTSRATKDYIDDVIEIVCMAFGIPAKLLKGDVADLDSAVNTYLMLCIKPLANMLNDEINRKWYGKEAFIKGTYARLDTTNIRPVDIAEIANSLDVLTRIGAHTIDDNLRKLGQAPLNDEIGRQRWMTKNYSTVETAIEDTERSVPNGEFNG